MKAENFFKIVHNPAPFGATATDEISVDFAYDQWMKATSPKGSAKRLQCLWSIHREAHPRGRCVRLYRGVMAVA